MLLSDKKAISVSEDEDEGILVGGSQVTVLELKTSHGHDGRSLSTLSPLGWGRWVLGCTDKQQFRKKFNHSGKIHQ